ncbi:enoyl-CoA hydratase-related protein [Variovorax sp. J22P168]|uniref:enoyl-CoA hydratase/isomerase family protein n=1 Tax=Variovorax jilinensis TaxID=3053513 RepID=UPI002579028C|nr:enoyl-CoA hydratase-related protein [Variovorax sp. J22P168]MDM0015102.1 enoyl-CoA hydratase-related protein [Variovorax sp. J22P168]
MSSTSSIRVEMQDGLAVVSLAQPERGNPFDGDFTQDFKQVFCDLWDIRGLRAVLLRADGANFSVGGDLKKFYPIRDSLGPLVRRWTADLHMGLQRAWQLPVPIVAAVQGFAMGGGAALMAGCDVVVAGESTRIGSAFAQLGFSCDSGSSATFTARMGPSRARRFVLLAEVLKSDEALQTGLIDRVVPDGSLQDEAMTMAKAFASGPTVAYAETKRLFLRAGAAHIESQLEDEALTLARVASTTDAQEGIAALTERRKPVFRGA